MKIEVIKRAVSIREWAFGIHAHGAKGTLVVFIGTAWRQWGFSHGACKETTGNAFGLCAGPLTIGGVVG
jgi:hypothetical protein